MEGIQAGPPYRAGIWQIPEGPGVPTTGFDLLDPKSSVSVMGVSLQSLAYPCCYLHGNYVGVD